MSTVQFTSGVPAPDAPIVFLSHTTENQAWVEWVADQARAVGVIPYLAERDHQPGTYHAEKIRHAISESSAVLVLMTEAAFSSQYVSQEIGAALQEHRLVVALVDPILHDRDRAMLEGVEVLWFDYQNATDSVAPLISTLTQIVAAAGAANQEAQFGHDQEPASPLQPGLQASWNFEGNLQLSPGQALVGLAVVALIIGVIVVAARNGGAPSVG